MSEYIEREAAIEAINGIDWYKLNDDGRLTKSGTSHNKMFLPFIAVKETLKHLPAADVRPVVRGTWVGIDDYPHEDWECDHCGFVVEGTDDPWNYYHFCPNCGARMEES